jgi:hypothetical protein
MEILTSLGLEPWQWAVAIFVGVLVGFAKTGIGGAGILCVPLMAMVFEAKQSVGVLVVMLCMADWFAVKYYHRHANWKYIWKPMPWAVLGILIGVVVGKDLESEYFGKMIGSIVLIIIGLMIWRERSATGEDGTEKEIKIPDSWYFAAIIGMLGGFTTMVGNAAGPVWTIYLLAVRLPKYEFIGTGAWFFLILNHFKIPFHIFSWETISRQTFAFDVAMLPAIIVGAILGIFTVKRINEKSFRHIIQGLAIVAAIKLLAG